MQIGGADARIFAKEEVINLLVAEYDYDTDIAVQREESLRIGMKQGFQQGIEPTEPPLQSKGKENR